MSFLSAIGNAVSSFFGGGSNDQKKKKQQQQISVAPNQNQIAARSQQQNFPAPNQLSKPPQNAPAQSTFTSPIQMKPKAPPEPSAPEGSIKPAQTQDPFAPQNLKRVATSNPLGPNAPTTTKQSVSDRIINTVANATARAGVGALQAGSQAFDYLTPGKGQNRIGKSLDQSAKSIDAADLQKGGQSEGAGGKAAYEGLQVAENIPALAKGAVDVVENAPKLVRGAIKGAKALPGLIDTAGHAIDDFADAHSLAREPKEVAPGVKSVNPNPEPPAPDISANPENVNAPAPSAEPVNATPPTPQIDEGGNVQLPGQTPPDTTVPGNFPEPTPPAAEPPAKIIQESPVAPPEPAVPPQPTPAVEPPAPVATTPQAAPTVADAAKNAAEGAAPAEPLDANGNPSLVSDKTAAEQTEAQGVSPNQVQTAPRVHQQALSEAMASDLQSARSIGQKFKGAVGMHTPLDMKQIDADATAAVAKLEPDDIVKAYSATDGIKIETPEKFTEAVKALDKLTTTPGLNVDDEGVQNAVTNLLNGIDEYASKAGQQLNSAKILFDDMPVPLKSRYIVKQLDKLRKAKGLDPLSDDQINGFSQDVNKTLVASKQLQDQFDVIRSGVIDAYNKGIRSGLIDINDQQKTLDNWLKELDDIKAGVSKLNGAIKSEYDDYLPDATKTQKAADTARSLMLASVTGPLNDIGNTGANVLRYALERTGSGLLGKVVNAVAGAGKVRSDTANVPTLLRTAVQGFKKSGGEIFKGDVYAGDLQKAVKSGARGGRGEVRLGGKKSLLNNSTRIVGNLREIATNVSAGVRDAEVQGIVRQHGLQAGLKGSDLRDYVRIMSRVADPKTLQEAQRVHDVVNNLNDNVLTDTIGKVFQNKKTGTGNLIAQAIMPFTKWVTANWYNQITDKNVVAQLAKLSASVVRKDAQGAVDAVGKIVAGTGSAAAAGYWLAQNSKLSETNPEGYHDGGMYMVLGNHYIPLGEVFGHNAPDMIIGAKVHEMMNGTKPLDALNSGVEDIGRAVGTTDLAGGDNPITQTTDLLNQKTPTRNLADLGSQALYSAVGQFIPAAFGDINAGINQARGIQEAPQTTAKKTHTTPTGKVTQVTDVPASQLLKAEARIPVLSQTMQRNPDRGNPELLDRVTHGDRATSKNVEDIQTAKATATSQASNAEQGIPDPTKQGFDGAVEKQIETGHIQKAIKGLQQKIASDQKSNTVAPSTYKALQSKVTQLQVADKAGLKYDDMKLYNDTTLKEWRDMGDPTSDSYDPKTYQALWDVDQKLAKAGVAGTIGIGSYTTKASDTQKFSAKAPAKKKSGGATGARNAAGGTISSATNLGALDLSQLKPKKISDVKIPTITAITPDQLVKKRAISVKAGVA